MERVMRQRLDDRTWAILKHLQRNWLSTAAVIHRLFYSAQAPLNTVHQKLRRMALKQLVKRHEIFTDEAHYTLGPAALKLFGLSPRHGEIAEGALVQRLAELEFFCQPGQVRKRLLPHELIRSWPFFARYKAQALHRTWYVDLGEEDAPRKRLTLVISAFSATSVSRKLHQLRRWFHRWQLEIPELYSLVESDSLALAILATRACAEAYAEALTEEPLPIPVRVHGNDDLLSLL